MTEKTIRRAIAVSWTVLIVCFAVSLFGGELFNFAFQTDRAKEFEAYLESALWLQIVIAVVFNYVELNLIYLTICEKRLFKPRIHLILIPYFIGVSTAKVLLYNAGLFKFGDPIDLISYFIVPFILLGKPFKIKRKPFEIYAGNTKYLRPVIAFVLAYGFQIISAKTKSYTVNPVIICTFAMEIIFMIDILIMTTLYYLHTQYALIKKENQNATHGTIGK